MIREDRNGNCNALPDSAPFAPAASEPSVEFGAQGRDVAACVREARRQLGAHPQRDVDTGQAAAGNTLAMGSGVRSVALQTALAPVRDGIYRATLADLGFDDEERPPETVRMTARNLAALDVMAETFWTYLETRGVLTTKGKTRSAVNTLLSIMDRQTKLASLLGLERKAKRVPTIEEWAEAHDG